MDTHHRFKRKFIKKVADDGPIMNIVPDSALKIIAGI